MNVKGLLFGGMILVGTGAFPATPPEALKGTLAALRAVGSEGKGNVEAAAAWKRLVQAETSSLPAILAAMDDANDLAANWLRSAVDAIVERELRAGGVLPVAPLRDFLRDTRHDPRARRLAYELIVRTAPKTAEELIPGMVNDPSLELRHDAVQRLIEQANQALARQDTNNATLGYREALQFVRDERQTKKISGELRKLGHEVDLPRHFGFLTHWKLIGPFNNAGLAGFDTAYPPEREINLQAEYEGKSGKVRWVDYATAHEYGMVDINKPFGSHKGVVAYAYTEFNAATARPAELRLGCKNGWKIWFNGRFLFGRDEYHRGARIDQYRLPVKLQAGRNTLLVKVCQNEEVQDWTKEWEFQLRVCDEIGTALLAKDRPSTPKNPITADGREAARR